MTKCSCCTPRCEIRHGERGSATVKFLAVIVSLFLIGHAAFNYLTAWYQCTHFRDAMDEAVTQAYAIPNSNLSVPENLKQRLRKVGNEDGVPANALIKVEKQAGGMRAQVAFVRDVNILPFDMYKYKYEFDYVATPPSGISGK